MGKLFKRTDFHRKLRAVMRSEALMKKQKPVKKNPIKPKEEGNLISRIMTRKWSLGSEVISRTRDDKHAGTGQSVSPRGLRSESV